MTDDATAVESIDVVDEGRAISLTFEDMMRYHGPGSPGGVAHGFKVMERAFPLLGDGRPPQRREVTIRTAFAGPGARDAFEVVTRALTEQRYHVDPGLARTERGTILERYLFMVGYRGRVVTLQIRDGFVVEEFIVLSRKAARTVAEEHRLVVLKQEMTDRLMARPAAEVYDVD